MDEPQLWMAGPCPSGDEDQSCLEFTVSLAGDRLQINYCKGTSKSTTI